MSTQYPFLKSAREEWNFDQLLTAKHLVPYVGPDLMKGMQTKTKILTRYIQMVRKDYLEPDDLETIGSLSNADAFAFLFEKTGRIIHRKLPDLDDAWCDPADADKVRHFTAAFPGLKVTGLVDTLLDRWVPDADTSAPITDTIDLQTDRILKLNGDLRHPETLALATGQINARIRAIYGALNQISGKASLLYLGREETPKALQNRNRLVQFIILSRTNMKAEILRNYNELNIIPIWTDQESDLVTILAALAQRKTSPVTPEPDPEPEPEPMVPDPPVSEAKPKKAAAPKPEPASKEVPKPEPQNEQKEAPKPEPEAAPEPEPEATPKLVLKAEKTRPTPKKSTVTEPPTPPAVSQAAPKVTEPQTPPAASQAAPKTAPVAPTPAPTDAQGPVVPVHVVSNAVPRPLKRPADQVYTLHTVRLRQVQGFEELTFQLALDPETGGGVTLIQGGNCTGKTSLLRAIALGLCHPNGAAALLRHYDGFFVRQGQNEAEIDLLLKARDGNLLRMLTTVRRAQGLETITQACSVPAEGSQVQDVATIAWQEASWTRVAVNGFGTVRYSERMVRIAKSNMVADAVESLFCQRPLAYPEHNMRSTINATVSRRRGQVKLKSKVRQDIEALLTHLLFSREDGKVTLASKGIVVEIAGQRLPLDAQSEGLQSTAAWLLALIAAKATAGTEVEPTQFEGLVLLDEIANHMDDDQQASIAARLSRCFPKIQWVLTTHSPRCMKSLARVPAAQGYQLQIADNGSLHLQETGEA